MWMQVLAASKVPVLGRAFPRRWKQTLSQANPEGFFESLYRQGVYFRTNPHPVSGHYVEPPDVNGYAVKVFIPGVLRSERAYIEKLVANVRPWREYCASMRRLYALEDRATDAQQPAPFRFPPAFEWWMENHALIRDITLRRYPARLLSYPAIVRDPEATLGPVLRWLEVPDVSAGLAAIKPEHHTQRDVTDGPDEIEPEHAEIFDALFDVVERGETPTRAFLDRLGQLNRSLLPRLRALQLEVAKQAARSPTIVPEPVDGLPGAKP